MRKLPKEQFRTLVQEVKRRASILEIAEDCGIGLRQEGACYKGFCPFHDDSATPSFAIWDDSGKWRCFGACQDGGDVLKLYQKAHGVNFRDALFDLANRYGVLVPGSTSNDASSGEAALPASMTSKTSRSGAPRKAGQPTEEQTYEAAPLPREPVDPEDLNRIWPYDRAEAVYIYRLVGGGVVHEVRYPNPKRKKKDSMFIRPTEWGLIYGLKDREYYRRGHCWFYVNDKTPKDAERKCIAGAQVHLYRPEVLERARKGEDWIFLVEGPKDADTAIELGLYATTPACGASGLRTYQAEELRDHLVAVVGDNDVSGTKGAAKRAKMLRGLAREVRILPPLGGNPGSGYDLTDFAEEKKREGQTHEHIREALQAKLEKAATEDARPGTPLESLLTDAANADRFVRRWGRDYRYCEKLRCWVYWDGSRFAEDWLNRAKHAARITAESIYAEAAEIAKGSDDEETKAQAEALRKHATRSLDDRRIHAMLSQAKASPRVAVTTSDFDRDPYQLNTPTGLLDVRTNGWRPHRNDPDEDEEHPMVSKVIGVTYDSEATCPLWERYLREIFVDPEGQPDEKLIAFIQVAVGYSLTGSTREHAIFILRGGGSNGKTVFVETLGRLLGDYSHTLQFDSLLAQKTANQNHPDIADLRGKRIAWASESAIGARFNEALLKQLSGGDRITAARKYANPVTFEATHKLWLASNHSPRTYDLSEGFWRRVHQVPFRVKFPRHDAFVPGRPLERRRDPDLKEKLIEELPGILNWALEGCQRWLADGLGMCDAVRQATAEYRADQDPLAAFLEDCCVLDPDGSVPVRELYSTYEDWCEKAGEDVKDRRVFGRLLTERGVETGKSMSTRVRRGIRLRRADDLQSEASEQPDLHPPVQPPETPVAPFDPTASRPPF